MGEKANEAEERAREQAGYTRGAGARSLSGLGSVGCKLTAAVHFSSASWPIAMAMSLRIRQKLSSLGPIFASTP